MKINVLIISPCFGVGGLEQVILSIIKGINRAKYNIVLSSLLAPDPGMENEVRKHNIPFYVIKKRPGIDWPLPLKISKIIKRENIQIINSHDIGATVYAVPGGLLAGVKYCVHTDHSQILTKKKYHYIYPWLFRKYVSHSITVSDHLKDYLQKMGIPGERIVTIPNGIDTERFSRDYEISSLRKEYGLIDGEIVIGSIGRLTEQKGFEYLIKAFGILSEHHSNLKLVIVGDGELREHLESMVCNSGLKNKVVFAGIRQDVPQLLKMFDIFALGSLWEGQPITIMEAMAAGRPIVVTDVGGNNEILKSQRYGLTVPAKNEGALAEAINIFINNKDLAKTMGYDAMEYSKNTLDYNSMVKKYETVFDEVLNIDGIK